MKSLSEDHFTFQHHSKTPLSLRYLPQFRLCLSQQNQKRARSCRRAILMTLVFIAWP